MQSKLIDGMFLLYYTLTQSGNLWVIQWAAHGCICAAAWHRGLQYMRPQAEGNIAQFSGIILNSWPSLQSAFVYYCISDVVRSSVLCRGGSAEFLFFMMMANWRTLLMRTWDLIFHTFYCYSCCVIEVRMAECWVNSDLMMYITYLLYLSSKEINYEIFQYSDGELRDLTVTEIGYIPRTGV